MPNLTIVAVPLQIYALTQSSAYVGLTGLFGLVPLIVFGLWGGAAADVFDRRTILLGDQRRVSSRPQGCSSCRPPPGGTTCGCCWLSVFRPAGVFAVNQPTRISGHSQILPRMAAAAGLELVWLT